MGGDSVGNGEQVVHGGLRRAEWQSDGSSILHSEFRVQ
jgi:hypothetical protein